MEAHRRVRLVRAVHDCVQQQLANRRRRIVRRRPFPQHRVGDRTRLRRQRHERLQLPQDGDQVAAEAACNDRLVGHRRPRPADELNPGAGSPAQRFPGEQQRSRLGRAVGSQIVEPQRRHLLRDAAFVLGDHLAVHGGRKVGHEEEIHHQVVQGAAAARARIEGPLQARPLLDQNPLLLLVGASPGRTDANPDSPLVAHRRQVRRQHLDDGHLALGQHVLLNGHGRERLDVHVRAQRREIPQQHVGDGPTAHRAVVFHADDEVTRLSVIGEIVGEGADRFPELVRVRRRDGELDAIGLVVGDQRAQRLGRQHDPSSDSKGFVTGDDAQGAAARPPLLAAPADFQGPASTSSRAMPSRSSIRTARVAPYGYGPSRIGTPRASRWASTGSRSG